MTRQRFKVGIVGLQPGRSWAARAHIPALRALSNSYEIVGVANTSLASAQKAAAEIGLPRAFANVAELIAAPEVDIVAVTVKVPHHLEIVKAAFEAGKHVYCEWPLGNGWPRPRNSPRSLGPRGAWAWFERKRASPRKLSI
jgi:predicted dehydrogenase